MVIDGKISCAMHFPKVSSRHCRMKQSSQVTAKCTSDGFSPWPQRITVFLRETTEILDPGSIGDR